MNNVNKDTSAAFSDFLRQQTAVLRNGETARPLGVDEALAEGGRLRGKVVLVTGAGSGFGKAFSLAAGRFGAKLVLGDVNATAVEDVVEEIKAAGGEATAVQCDVANWDSQVKIFRHGVGTYGGIDVVIANAGIGEANPPLLDLSEGKDGEPAAPTLKTLEVNLIGLIYTCKLAFFHLNKNPSKSGKSIVLVSSLAGLTGLAGAPTYTAAKHGVLGIMRSLTYDASVYGISINSIHPTCVKTPILGAFERLLIAGVPTAPVEDVAAAIVVAAARTEPSGSAFVVDTKGILELPHAQMEKQTYYDAVMARAVGLISWTKWFSDIIGGLTLAFRRRN